MAAPVHTKVPRSIRKKPRNYIRELCRKESRYEDTLSTRSSTWNTRISPGILSNGFNRAGASPFSKLSLELKQHIFSFIHVRNDRKAVRLVCMDWRNASEYVFGHEFRTFRVYADAPFLKTLSRLGPNKILRAPPGFEGPKVLLAIQGLIIDHIKYHTRNPKYPPDLKELFRFIPHGQLQLLHFTDTCQIDHLRLLLGGQHNLRHLALPPRVFQFDFECFDEKGLTEFKDHISSCKQLQSLHISIKNTIEDHDAARFIVHALPNLRCLSLDMMRTYNPEPSPGSPFFQNPEQLTKLINLEVLQLTGPWPWCTLDHINFRTLVVLKLRNLRNTSTILRRLNESPQSLADIGTSLRSLEVILAWVFNDTSVRDDLELMIKSFSGLHTLVIYTENNGLINPSTIEPHAASLRHLSINSNGDGDEHCYSAEQVQSILRTCQDLETFAIRLPIHQRDSHDPRSIEGIETGSSLPQILKTIAMLKKLRALRVFYPRSRNSSFDSNHLDLANMLLKVLGYYGSSIELLCTKPIWMSRRYTRACLYYRPKTSIDILGRSQTVALPFPRAEAELSDMEIIFEEYECVNMGPKLDIWVPRLIDSPVF
ncbi:hypothetical protein DM02DRAFT_682228 [Periconia macrospinosa]|uniref:F-box domain-containing protein n=1 Tax=Periconia macrospinosa TaxID=97972 RepID=A0A2V1DKK6_9PLEO|nr:hypothetical protein DM02DRAFT_682228 [Periconia macrospinosa]